MRAVLCCVGLHRYREQEVLLVRTKFGELTSSADVCRHCGWPRPSDVHTLVMQRAAARLFLRAWLVDP